MSSAATAAFAVALVVGASAAQEPSAGAVRERDVRALESALADDSMEGRLAGSPGAAKAARLIARTMQEVGLEPTGDSGYFGRVPLAVTRRGITLRSSDADDPTARAMTGVNIIGLLRGIDSALVHEVVLVDAHFDHLGVGKPVHGDSIYNGADDDASGTVAVLEVARALAAGPRPKRSILFVATTAEEEGALGMQWLVDHFPLPLDSVVANLETEMIGRPDPLAGGRGRAWLTGYERSTMGDEFRRAGLPIVPDPHPEQHFFERSDNIVLALRGIPAQTLSSFGLHRDYHEPSDELSRVDIGHMTAVITAEVRAVLLLANDPPPTWKPGGRPTPAGDH